MSNLTTALAIMLSINVIFILSQAAVLEVGAEIGTEQEFFSCSGSMLSAFEQNACQNSTRLLADENPASILPSGESAVSPTTGNIFTDAFSSIKSWFLDSLGLRYLTNLLSGPYNIIKSMGLPETFAFAIGGLWYGITLFLLVAFFTGRDA